MTANKFSMKNIILLAIVLSVGRMARAQVYIPQPYIFSRYISVHDSVRGSVFLQGQDSLETKAIVRTKVDTIYFSGDTIYYHKSNSTKFIVIPVLTSTQITQIAESFGGARFDTTARALWLYENDGDSLSVIIPGGSGGGGGSGITAQTSAKNINNIVVLTANTGASVAFSVHDTLFVYADTVIWNGKMDSTRVNTLLSGKINNTDTAGMLAGYARITAAIRWGDTTHYTGLGVSQQYARYMADSAAGAIIIPVLSVAGRTGNVTLSTNDVSEGTNLYFTTARARSSLSGMAPIIYNSSTGAIGADTSTRISGLSTISGAQRLADSAAVAVAGALTTSAVPEGSNQYFTQARARSAISAAAPVTYNSSTGVAAVDTATNISGLLTRSDGRRIADSAAAQAVGSPYTANAPILVTSRVISADTATQATGLSTIANTRRIADSAASAASGGTFVSPTSSSGHIVFTGNGQVKGTALTIDLAPNLIVADTTADSASLHNLLGSNGVSIANGTKVMLSSTDVTVGISPGGIDSSRLAQSPTAVIKATINAAAPLTYFQPSGQVGADTSTQTTGLSTIAGARRLADSAAIATVGAAYTGNAPISVSSKIINADTATNVHGLLTRSDGRRIADSAAIALGGSGAVSGYNVQWIYGGHTNIPAKGGDSLYINSNLTGKHINVTMYNGYASTRLVDSATWAYEGSKANQLYFKFKTTSDTITFCNTSNVQSLVNGTEFDIQAGGQGFPMYLDTGGTILGPPIVNAGSNQTVIYPASSATLTGSATPTNPGGSIASYLWSIVSEPTGASASISAPTLASTPVTNMSLVGPYVYKLTATDNTGDVGSAQTTVTVSAATSLIVNFSATATSASGAMNFYGDPTTSLSFTDANTGWTVSSITAGWVKYAGQYYGGSGNGATAASSDGAFTQAQIGSNMYNSTNFSTSGYSLQISNLPAGTYTIELLGSIPNTVFNWSGTSEFHVLFGSGSDNISTAYGPNGSGSTGNLTPQGPGTTNVSTGSFTGTITSGQVIKIAVGYNTAASGTNLGFINGLKIVKTS